MAGVLDTLYARAPIWAQQAAVAAYGLWWYRRRFGPEFHAFTHEIEARDRWTGAQFDAYQDQRLGALFEAAWRAPHYARVFAEHGVRRDMPPREALRAAPLLAKETLRASARELLTQPRLPRGASVFRSSGTTGTPTDIFFAHRFHQLVQAFFEARNRRWAGVRYDSRRAMFGVRKVCGIDQTRPPFWRRSPAENLTYFSIYHLGPAFMLHYLDHLAELGPEVIMGYPSSLATLARFALETGRALPPARAIITTSETVTPEIRDVLERAFGGKVFDNYCAVEACMLATQCELGRYHLSPDFGVFEILDDAGNPAPPGQVGTAVCTGLHNTLQPLIRYQIGDAVSWSTEAACPCGRHMPMLGSIEGRIEDLCITPDGREVLRFDTVFKGVTTIREAQVVQEALDHFVINVVPTPHFSDADRRQLESNMRAHVGQVTTTVRTLEHIERTAAGKFRPVISHVRRARRP